MEALYSVALVSICSPITVLLHNCLYLRLLYVKVCIFKYTCPYRNHRDPTQLLLRHNDSPSVRRHMVLGQVERTMSVQMAWHCVLYELVFFFGHCSSKEFVVNLCLLSIFLFGCLTTRTAISKSRFIAVIKDEKTWKVNSGD